jgi:hypothetical protein
MTCARELGLFRVEKDELIVAFGEHGQLRINLCNRAIFAFRCGDIAGVEAQAQDVKGRRGGHRHCWERLIM